MTRTSATTEGVYVNLVKIRDQGLLEPELDLRAEGNCLRVAVSDSGNDSRGCASIALDDDGVAELVKHASAWLKKRRPMRTDSFGTCSKCGHYGPGPAHECKGA